HWRRTPLWLSPAGLSLRGGRRTVCVLPAGRALVGFDVQLASPARISNERTGLSVTGAPGPDRASGWRTSCTGGTPRTSTDYAWPGARDDTRSRAGQWCPARTLWHGAPAGIPRYGGSTAASRVARRWRATRRSRAGRPPRQPTWTSWTAG